MALSNIFREPMREITEQITGTIVVLIAVIPAGYFGWWNGYRNCENAKDPITNMIFGFFLGVCLEIMGFGIICLMHAVGETVCDFFARNGIELRPRNRP